MTTLDLGDRVAGAARKVLFALSRGADFSERYEVARFEAVEELRAAVELRDAADDAITALIRRNRRCWARVEDRDMAEVMGLSASTFSRRYGRRSPRFASRS